MIIFDRCLLPVVSYKLQYDIMQVFNDAIEALRVSYKKMNPFCVPFATTNMGSAILAMDLVIYNILSCMVNNDRSYYSQKLKRMTVIVDGSYFL